MNKDQIKGRTEEIAGKTKKVIGGVVGNDTLKNKGRVEEAAGKVRATYGDAKDKVKKDWDDDKRDEPRDTSVSNDR